jgi:predicted dehydrogenase
MNRASPMPSQPLTVILAGLGGMGEVWLSALSGPEAEALGVRLIGICDLDPVRAAEALARRGLSLPVHESISRALSTAPDLVVDCTTSNLRLAIAREALISGVHVLCEPPLAPDEQTATQLIGASARSRGILAVSQGRRFLPGVRQLRDLVKDGTLGRPQTLSADLHMAPRFGGIRQSMRHVMLRDMAIHAFDAARCILGADALSVACLERTPEGQPFAHGPEVHATFDMSDGSLFVFAGNWAEHGPPTSWNGSWRLALSAGAARWDGEGNALAWGPAPAEAAGFLPASRPHALPVPPLEQTDLLGTLESIAYSIREGRQPETHARDSAASLAMVFAAICSAENGGRREPVQRLGEISDASNLPRRTPVKRG